MAQDGKVIINIDSNAAKTQQEFASLDATTAKYNQTLKNTQNTANSSKSSLSAYGNQLKANRTSASGLSGALGSLGGSLGSLGGLAAGAAAGLAAMKLKDYGQYALQTSAAFEQLAISFRVMTGSAQTGQALTDAIIELGAKTPMTAQQLSRAAQLLLSFGESAENIIPDLKLLGDITGGEANRFSQLALVFAQVGANGKLMGQDLLQMVNAGFNPLQIISQKTGKSMGELRKEMEEGRISFQMVAQAMKDATAEGGRYFGLMEQQSQSLNGRLSTLGDTWEQVAKNIGDVFAPAAKAAVNLLIRLGEQVLNLQQKMQAFQKSFNGLTVESQQQRASGFQQQANELYKLAQEYEARGGRSKGIAAEYRKQADEFAAAAERARQKAEQFKKSVQTNPLSKSGANTGFNATVLSSNSSSGSSANVAKQKDAYEKLQLAAQNARREVELNAIAYGTSSPQVQQAFEKYRNLNTQLNDINKIFEENTQAVKDNGGAYSQLQQKISDTRNQLLNMAVSGQGDTAQFTMLKNTLKQYETQAQQANTAVTNSVGLSWKNISNTISSQLSYALTTPLQEGENAFERLGNVALNVIGQIAQAWLSNSLGNLFNSSNNSGGLLGTIGSAAGSFFGPIGSAVGGFFGNTIGKLFNANGNAFVNGHLQPFANGGVVSSPTMFPMSGNRTGIMGEKGAEAIMPLKRTPSGQLGVQAQTSPATVNVYNQSDSRIETVQRPDGDTDIFIRRVNNALRSERTQAGFGAALQRNQSRGVQAS